MNSFSLYLQNKYPISSNDLAYIESHTNSKSFLKGGMLTKQGDIEDTIYFIEEGVVQLYFEREDRDITFNFGFPNQFISCFSSFLKQEPSEFNLQALTHTKAVSLGKKELENIYLNTECGLSLARMLMEETIIYISQRETDFVLKSPEERYLALFDKNHRLIQEIPLKYLASYIGITPQALSRIRSRIN